HRDYKDNSLLDVVGKVIENDRPNRLVISWASPKQAADPDAYSRVTFELKESGPIVKLTVTHDQLDENMAKGINKGWPVVLASLKTFLETGEAMPGGSERGAGDFKALMSV
ncbi:MAG TPA: SRPBCC domain-containing protein, partial [Gemmatimonadales bacterium]|nr:SRPBCC domain-containing protein [Gemmatimonadales bacterium]